MPGVPPNAMNTLKRAFKSIFRRGKKNKKDLSTTTSNTAAANTQQSPSVSQQRPSNLYADGPPQLPPVVTSSPITRVSDPPDKPLPATHPLATGRHEKPQEAVPQNTSAQPGPLPQLNIAEESRSTRQVKEPEAIRQEIVESQPVATENVRNEVRAGGESAPAEPPKANIVEAPKTEDQLADTQPKKPHVIIPESNPVAKENVPPRKPAGIEQTAIDDPPATTTTTTTTTVTKLPAPSAEQTRANGSTTTTPNDTPNRPLTSDEKFPMMEEPPPIKAVRAAPGMSATSGPLEDFPEGGEMYDL